MMRIPKNKYISLGLQGLGIAAAFYMMFAYVGPYRWLSDLQTRLLGFYLPYVSLGVPLLIFIIPGQLVAPAPVAEFEALEEEDFPTFEAEMIHKKRRLIRRLRTWAIGSALAGAAAVLIGFAFPDVLPAPVPVDSNAGAAPPVGVPVLLTGVVDEAQIHNLATRGMRQNSDEYAAPLIGRGPVRYFIDLGSHEIDMRARLATIEREGRVEGMLRENGLQGEMRASFETDGVQIADPHYLLEPDGPTPRERVQLPGWVLLGIGGVLAIVMANAWRLIRKYRRQLAEMEAS